MLLMSVTLTLNLTMNLERDLEIRQPSIGIAHGEVRDIPYTLSKHLGSK